MLLGNLQAKVVSVVWKLGEPATAREIHREVLRRHPVELLTVVTVLNKLVTKGVLRRAKQDDVFHYAARLSEEEFMSQSSRKAIEGILSLGRNAVAASIVDVLAKHDPEQLAELGRLVRRRLNQSGRK